MQERIVNAATNNYYKDQNYPKKDISILCPVSLRAFPKNKSECDISNNAYAIGVTLPLIENPFTESKLISKRLGFAFRDLSYIYSTNYIFKTMSHFLPNSIMRMIMRDATQKHDFLISNVAGPKETLWFEDDLSLTNYYPLMTSGMHSTFILVKSYQNKFNIEFNVNEGLNLDPYEVLEYIENELDKMLLEFDNIKKNE